MKNIIHVEDLILKSYKHPLARAIVVKNEIIFFREGVVVEAVGRDGQSGWGEAAPLPGISEESFKKVIHQLKCLGRDWKGRSLPGRSLDLCLRLKKDLDRSLLAPSVIFALESAFISLAAAVQEVSIAEFLGGRPPRPVPSACLIQGDLKTVKEYGAQYAAKGFSVFKLKVGGQNIPLDVQKVEALREIIGFKASIRLDANAAWSLDEAIAFAFAIGKGQIDLIEEPCKNENDCEKFFSRTDIPWAIEAHSSQRPLEDWEGIRGLKAVVVKPMLCGGVAGFLLTKEIAARIGVPVIVSASFESPIGLKILANLAALTDQVCGLGTADWFGAEAVSLLGKGGIISPAQLT